MEKTRRSFSDRLNEFLADFREIDEDFLKIEEETLFLQTLVLEMTLAITEFYVMKFVCKCSDFRPQAQVIIGEDGLRKKGSALKKVGRPNCG